MAVSFQSGSSAYQSRTPNVVSISYSLNNTIDASALVVFGGGRNWATGVSLSSITYGPVGSPTALNLVRNVTNWNSEFTFGVGYMMSPPSGTNVVTINASASVNISGDIRSGAMLISGPTGTPEVKFSNYTAVGDNISFNVSSQPGGLVVSLGVARAEWYNDFRAVSPTTMVIGYTGNSELYYYPYSPIMSQQSAHASLPYTPVTYFFDSTQTPYQTNATIIALSFPPKAASLASSYFYDFEADTDGYMPAGWTMYNNWDNNVTGSVVNVSGDKRLRLSYASSSTVAYVYNSTIGVVDLTSTTVEIVAKWTPASVNSYNTALAIGIDNNTSAFGAYSMAVIFESSAWNIQPFNKTGTAAGAIATATPRFSLVAGTSYYVRYRKETTGVYKAKIWADGSSEPASWDITSTAYTSLTSGRIGLATYNNSNKDLSLVGISLDGSTAAITAPSAAAPVNTSPPTISGTLTQNQTLTASNGLWSNGPTSYTYQWYRVVNGVSTAISNATSGTYVLSSSDVGTTVRVGVTASNATGSATAYSSYTSTISGTTLSAPTISSGGSSTSSSIPIAITGGAGATGWTVQFKLSTEPTVWTNESTAISVGASTFTVDQSLTAGTSYDIRIAATDGTSTVYSATYTASTAAAGGGAPTITNVNVTNIITSTQTGVVITGTNLSGSTVSITQGTTTVSQTVTATSSTTATFNVVFDSTVDLKYGTATLTVSVTGQTAATSTITINPPDARSWVTLTSVESTSSNRLTSSPSDLAIGDQIEVVSVTGGAITDVTLVADGTYSALDVVKQFSVRIWDSTDSTWGTVGVQTTRRKPIITA